MKRLKWFLGSGIIFILLYLLLAFLTPFSKFLSERSVDNQISYLLSQENLDTKLQLRFPEGYVFFNSILVLAIIDRSNDDPKENKHFARELDQLILKLLSQKASVSFPTDQKLPHGAFYNGWVNFTIKKYLESNLITYSNFHPYLQTAHDSISNAIISSQLNELEILDSYPQAYWPADNLICIASLPAHAGSLSKRWITHINEISKGELIHHDNNNLRKARGSSQSLIIWILSQIDVDLAKEENVKFNRIFKKSILGIKLVREDINRKSFEDVDSGPVVLGFGSVATIMNTKAQKSIGQRSRITEGFLNMLGIPINLNGSKFYLFKREAMFDLFMLWTQV